MYSCTHLKWQFICYFSCRSCAMMYSFCLLIFLARIRSRCSCCRGYFLDPPTLEGVHYSFLIIFLPVPAAQVDTALYFIALFEGIQYITVALVEFYAICLRIPVYGLFQPHYSLFEIAVYFSREDGLNLT